jgi:Response regulator containing a CheY-like receiver domain and an HTH DNA-binding domain
MKKKIFVCEDHTIIIDGLQLLFERNDQYEIIGFTRHGEELHSWLSKLKPDILLLDLNLKESDGFTLLEELRKSNTQLKVLILTMYQEQELIDRARELNANAFLPKNISNEDIDRLEGSL